jgi:hypothetical protein
MYTIGMVTGREDHSASALRITPESEALAPPRADRRAHQELGGGDALDSTFIPGRRVTPTIAIKRSDLVNLRMITATHK